MRGCTTALVCCAKASLFKLLCIWVLQFLVNSLSLSFKNRLQFSAEILHLPSLPLMMPEFLQGPCLRVSASGPCSLGCLLPSEFGHLFCSSPPSLLSFFYPFPPLLSSFGDSILCGTPCDPSWHQTCDSSVLASQLLGLQACIAMPGRFGTFVCLETEFLYYVALALLELTMQTRLTVCGFSREHRAAPENTAGLWMLPVFRECWIFFQMLFFKYGLKRFNSIFHSF